MKPPPGTRPGLRRRPRWPVPWPLCGLVLAGAALAAEPPTVAGAAAPTRVLITGSREPVAPMGLLGERVALEAPFSLGTLDAEALATPGTNSLAAALARLPSVGENYATTGYHENFTVRGFTLDLGSSYRLNGLVVPAEFHLPVEVAGSIEVLQGVAAAQGALVGAGGTVNVLTRRAIGPDGLVVEGSGRGGWMVSGHVSRPLDADGRLALRLGGAHAQMRPPQPAAEGHRSLLMAAVDARLAPGLDLWGDLIAQHRSQPAVPGFQLLGGTRMPGPQVRDVNINRQPWSRPVANEGLLGTLRMRWQLADGLTLQAGAAQTRVHIDDNLATPYGCNSAPFQYFCDNGDFVLYDYHARELRTGRHLTAALTARLRHGAAVHALTLAADRVDRTVRQDDVYTSTVFDADGLALTQNIATTDRVLPAPPGTGVDRPRTRALQSSVMLADEASIGQWTFHIGLRAVLVDQQPSGARQHQRLPVAAATWSYAEGRAVYLSLARGLEFGSEAPAYARNAGALLPPRLSRQIELGWRGRAERGSSWQLAAFRTRRPYEFTLPTGDSWAGLGDHVSAGLQVHQGLELGYRSAPGLPWSVEASGSWLHARARGTGIAAVEGVQVQNVPRLAGHTRLVHAPRAWPGLEASLGWTHKGWRHARRDGLARVPGHDLLDLGLSWSTGGPSRRTVLALNVRNLTDRHHWRDAGEAYSADLLFPGAGRSMAASVRTEF